MDMKKEFVEMLRHTLGNEAQELCSVIADTEPSVSVRVNTAKGAHLPAGVQRVPWCEA
ncbi:MAG: rRNA cytosine-C5-methyltransferase, partial [Muribaculaceae bacterium]|nr:rRNA cytosine-C5-methyltransferase [Muribaculaceae bacterium]